jgi:hypothetical protein
MLSVDGQRSFPFEAMRLLLLNIVGSSPDSFAIPEAECPLLAAKLSIAAQTWRCESMYKTRLLIPATMMRQDNNPSQANH